MLLIITYCGGKMQTSKILWLNGKYKQNCPINKFHIGPIQWRELIKKKSKIIQNKMQQLNIVPDIFDDTLPE